MLGGIVGLVASGTYNSIPQACRNGSGPCSASNASTSGTAHSEATVSTIGLVAGAAFAAGGAVLYFTAPKATVSVAPSVGMSGVGARVAVAW